MIETESAIKKPVIDVEGKTFAEIELQQAVRWFKENGYHAWIDGWNVYIELESNTYPDKDNPDCGCYDIFRVQISAIEIGIRAARYRKKEAKNEKA